MSIWENIMNFVLRLANRGVDRQEEQEKRNDDVLTAKKEEVKAISSLAKELLDKSKKVNVEYQKDLEDVRKMQKQADSLKKMKDAKIKSKRIR